MKRCDFQDLRINDICVFKRGHDTGKKCKVIFIEDESILVKSVDSSFYGFNNGNKNLKLTGWHELDLYKV